jgi:hypothetical protein
VHDIRTLRAFGGRRLPHDDEASSYQLARAHVDHDADAIVEAYAPDAVIYDLAPPLGRRGLKRDSVAAWLGGRVGGTNPN